MIDYVYCNTFGFNENRISEHLELMGLGKADANFAIDLQKKAIRPHLKEIINDPTLGIRFKLELTLAIIPKILNLKGEFPITKKNLEILWKTFIKRSSPEDRQLFSKIRKEFAAL